MPDIKAVLFDLDGTLLDTAQDLISALHSLLQSLPSHHSKLLGTPDELRTAAGRGCKGLIKTGLNIDDNDERYPALAEQLLNHYETHLLDTTNFFPGIPELLDHLDQYQIPWGIVTNKPGRYTQIIADELKLTDRAKCIISGDSLTHRKPHPEPILHACQILQTSPQECLYVGDTYVDVLASQAAGSPLLVALYGYISELDDPKSWNAAGYISHPKDILNWFE